MPEALESHHLLAARELGHATTDIMGGRGQRSLKWRSVGRGWLSTRALSPVKVSIYMEPGELIWEGRVGAIPVRVGVAHSERIIAEWDSPQGPRQKVAESLEEFERSVLIQLLLSTGQTDDAATKEIVAAVEKAQADRPRPPAPAQEKRRKNPKARLHRRSRRPPRRW